MAVLIPDDLVRSSGLSESELRLELAVALFASDRLTLGQASRLAGLRQAEMLAVLAQRDIAVHYSLEDLKQDVANLDRIGPG